MDWVGDNHASAGLDGQPLGPFIPGSILCTSRDCDQSVAGRLQVTQAVAPTTGTGKQRGDSRGCIDPRMSLASGPNRTEDRLCPLNSCAPYNMQI